MDNLTYEEEQQVSYAKCLSGLNLRYHLRKMSADLLERSGLGGVIVEAAGLW